MLNVVKLVGRLFNDGRVNYGENKTFILAIPRRYTDGDPVVNTDYIRFISCPHLCEFINDNCKKGDILEVKGTIHADLDGAMIIAEKVRIIKHYEED